MFVGYGSSYDKGFFQWLQTLIGSVVEGTNSESARVQNALIKELKSLSSCKLSRRCKSKSTDIVPVAGFFVPSLHPLVKPLIVPPGILRWKHRQCQYAVDFLSCLRDIGVFPQNVVSTLKSVFGLVRPLKSKPEISQQHRFSVEVPFEKLLPCPLCDGKCEKLFHTTTVNCLNDIKCLKLSWTFELLLLLLLEEAGDGKSGRFLLLCLPSLTILGLQGDLNWLQSSNMYPPEGFYPSGSNDPFWSWHYDLFKHKFLFRLEHFHRLTPGAQQCFFKTKFSMLELQPTSICEGLMLPPVLWRLTFPARFSIWWYDRGLRNRITQALRDFSFYSGSNLSKISCCYRLCYLTTLLPLVCANFPSIWVPLRRSCRFDWLKFHAYVQAWWIRQ